MFYFELVVFILFIVPAVCVASYHFLLGLLGLVLRKKPRPSDEPRTHFGILIPAHNEENGIGQTIECLKNALDYPAELMSVYVVADNCTDKTAEVAASFGVRVLERHDTENRGKGYALKYAIPIILEETPCDGILVLDADCTLDEHALRYFDERLKSKPGTPLQLNYIVDNPDESATSYLLGVANCLENEFFYFPKDRLNLFITLRGTGMFLPRSVLERFPWNAFSIVEDTDYSLQLLAENISAGFVTESRVLSPFPTEQQTLNVQRKRWIGGTLAFSLFRGVPLMFKGLFTLNLKKIDAGFTLMVLSRPVILFQLLLTTILAMLLVFPLKTDHAIPLLAASLICWGLYFLYFCCGVVRLGLTTKRMKMLVRLPWEILSYLAMAVKSLLGGSSASWDRTPRT